MKTKPFKVGAVSVKPMERDAWMIRYRDPATDRDVRRRLAGLKEREVQSVAGNINQSLLTKGGYLPGKRPRALPVAEALAEAIELANTRDKTARERAYHAARFVEWLAAEYSAVRTWDQLRPAMLQKYVNTLERRGLAFDSVRLGIAPVKLAWRHMAENWPDLVKPLPRLRIKTPPLAQGQPAGPLADGLPASPLWLADAGGGRVAPV